MANFNSVQIGNVTAAPPVRNKANQDGGRIRYKEFIFVAPASGTAPAIGDRIIWGKLPVRARVIGHLSRMVFTAGTAACTINLGDNVAAARHLAATAINAAGSAVPTVAEQAQAAVADVTINSNVLANCKPAGAYQVGALITGTGIPAGTTITGVTGPINGVCQVTMSAVATATNAAVATTITGGTFETSDDSANAANSFTSANDDATLISTVAGAQIANNQVITLKVAYTQD